MIFQPGQASRPSPKKFAGIVKSTEYDFAMCHCAAPDMVHDIENLDAVVYVVPSTPPARRWAMFYCYGRIMGTRIRARRIRAMPSQSYSQCARWELIYFQVSSSRPGGNRPGVKIHSIYYVGCLYAYPRDYAIPTSPQTRVFDVVAMAIAAIYLWKFSNISGVS
ncbi:hypothetical protein B0H19DRAFT_711221 [Mycena capillaripes]|nr:hypothetical protein B0H19DRAFT_711221 [Mycena capillaripes]